jgi:hypothetical protein
LKLDCQAAELDVLSGASKVLQKVHLLLTEIRFDDLYAAAPPGLDTFSFLRAHGFQLRDISHIYKDLSAKRTLWIDAIFMRRAYEQK